MALPVLSETTPEMDASPCAQALAAMSDKNAREKIAVALKIPLLLAMKLLSSFLSVLPPQQTGRMAGTAVLASPRRGGPFFLSGCLSGGAAPDSLGLLNLHEAAVMH